MDPNTQAQLLDAAIVALGLPLLALAGRLAWAGVSWVVAQTKTTIDDRVAAKLAGLAGVVVKSTYMAYVKPLKAAGKWTPAAHGQAKLQAMAELKSYLGEKGLQELSSAFAGDLESLLSGAIEAAVHDNKNSSASSAAAVRPTVPSSANG